ncbi:MAG: CehA/McbA family metallohydrolase [Rhodothermales bacterium]
MIRRSAVLPAFILTVLLAGAALPARAQPRILLDRMVHLRLGPIPEWTSFPVETDGASWSLSFEAKTPPVDATLRFRQQDVKQSWQIVLNDTVLSALRVDENDLVAYLPVPAGLLRAGANTLSVVQIDDVADDIRIGEFMLLDRDVHAALSEAHVALRVTDADTGAPLPARITILNADGALQTVDAAASPLLAVRPGIVYTGNGEATFGVPAGRYTVYAGRGFEYGVDSVTIDLSRGKRAAHTLSIRREVPTPGYVSSDTHVHTWSFSRHGDATLEERLVTLAGEGIELPVATDHNQFVDYRVAAAGLGLDAYFTPVTGNEVTTPVGHVNIFPAPDYAAVPPYRVSDWRALYDGVFATPGIRVAVLNHGRDVHNDFRPFDPGRHLALVGANVDGWAFEANAMEVVNSSAQQTDVMQLFTDWFGLLNRGYSVTPIGSSDSHDVGRHFVGQGRTYVRVDDADAGRIDVDAAMDSFVRGRVLVSLGLLTEITVNDRYGPGDLAPASDQVSVSVRVLGPGWTRAETVDLYANGRLISTARIADGDRAGVKWAGSWTLPRFAQDVYLVAIARGPGVRRLYWPIARPYLPAGPVWMPQVIGATGAVRIDSDGDGRWSSAYAIARNLMAETGGELRALFDAAAPYDEAVAAQLASLLDDAGRFPGDATLDAYIRQAPPALQAGFDAYSAARRAAHDTPAREPGR